MELDCLMAEEPKFCSISEEKLEHEFTPQLQE